MFFVFGTFRSIPNPKDPFVLPGSGITPFAFLLDRDGIGSLKILRGLDSLRGRASTIILLKLDNGIQIPMDLICFEGL